jgi:hypothetical protein
MRIQDKNGSWTWHFHFHCCFVCWLYCSPVTSSHYVGGVPFLDKNRSYFTIPPNKNPKNASPHHYWSLLQRTVSGGLGRWAVGSPSVCDWTLGIPTSGCLGCGWKVHSPGGWFMIRSGIIRTNKPGSTDGCWILLILFTSNTTDTGIIWNYQVGLLFSPS